MKQIKTKVMKTKNTLLAIALFVFGTHVFTPIFAQRITPNSSQPFSIIKVVNTASNTVTVFWNEDNFEEIEIIAETGDIFMPTIPLFDSKQITLNDLVDGTYFLNFKKQGTVVQTQIIKIQDHSVLAGNI
jgi:hypothetical protein